MDLLRALDDCGGAGRHAELVRAGVPERALARGVAMGHVVAVGHGTYALPSVDPEVAMARLFRAQIGCVTACAHWGLPLWGVHDRPHLVVPRTRSSSRRDPQELGRVVLHRATAWSPERLWVRAADAIDQAGWCTSPLGQLVLVDAALHAGLLLPGDIAHLGFRDVRRRAWLRRMASGAAESPLETVARVALVTAGFAIREQVVFSEVGRVDLVVEDAVVVESDGWQFHQDRDAFERDRARDRHLLARGLPVMRLTARELRGDLVGVVTQVARVVGRAPRKDAARQLAWMVGRTGVMWRG